MVIGYAQPPTPPAKTANPQATALLRGALKNLENLKWMETQISQQTMLQGIKVHAQGRHVIAPNRKVYYQLEVQVGDAKGLTRIVCDGQTIWRWEQTTIQKTTLAQLEEALAKANGDDIGKQLREEILADHGFFGIRPVLQDLQKRITFTSVQETQLDSNLGASAPQEHRALTQPGSPLIAVYLLEGEWNKPTVEKFAPPRKPEDTRSADAVELWEKRKGYLFVPRKCRLFLARNAATPAASTLWPYRLEWHGPKKVEGPDELLSVIEFRNPIFQPPSAAEMEQIFSVKLGDADAKLVKDFDPTDSIEKHRKLLERQRQAEERTKSLRPTDGP